MGINVPTPVLLPMFKIHQEQLVHCRRRANAFYGQAGLNFFTQTKTVTSPWKADDDTLTKAKVTMPSQR